MGEPEKRSRSVKAASSTVAARNTSKNEEGWDHIQDAGQRKKAQNRIAQRLYRKCERIKKRLEDLEQFRDAAASDPSQLASLIARSVEPNDSRSHGGIDSPETLSPTVATSSPCHPCSRQADHMCTGCLASTVTPQEEDETTQTTTSSSPSLPDQVLKILTPADTALLFEPFMHTSEHSSHNNQSDCTIWELDEDLAVETNATGINGRPYGEEDQSSLDQPFYGLSKSMLLSNNKDPTQQFNLLEDSQDGKTALHVASENGQHSTVQLLLSLQPELLAQDNMGRTALHLAVINKHEEIIQELSKSKSGLEVRDRTGQTALHAAVTSGKERTVACLLAAGADLESKDMSGRTALHLAALRGYNHILQLLLDSGADLNAKIKR